MEWSHKINILLNGQHRSGKHQLQLRSVHTPKPEQNGRYLETIFSNASMRKKSFAFGSIFHWRFCSCWSNWQANVMVCCCTGAKRLPANPAALTVGHIPDSKVHGAYMGPHDPCYLGWQHELDWNRPIYSQCRENITPVFILWTCE